MRRVDRLAEDFPGFHRKLHERLEGLVVVVVVRLRGAGGPRGLLDLLQQGP